MITRNPISPSLLFLLVGLTAGAPAMAQDNPEGSCSTDADCPERGVCQKAQWVEDCPATPEGDTPTCDNTVHEAEFGTCHVPPAPCESDAECGEYESCQEEGATGTCTGSSDGEVICDVPQETSSVCLPDPGGSCESDADCPREFECVASPEVCTQIACPEDEPDCNSCSSGGSECRPKVIECESDQECPTDWACNNTIAYECSGSDGAVDTTPDDSGGSATPGSSSGTPSTEPSSGSTPMPGPSGDGGGTEPALDGMAPRETSQDEPSQDEPSQDEPEPCISVQVVGQCFPSAWDGDSSVKDVGRPTGGTGGPDSPNVGPGEDGTASDPGSSGGDVAEEGEGTPPPSDAAVDGGAGCSSSPAGPRLPQPWLLLGLGLTWLLRRRRVASR